jgi:hypothetical protein
MRMQPRPLIVTPSPESLLKSADRTTDRPRGPIVAETDRLSAG